MVAQFYWVDGWIFGHRAILEKHISLIVSCTIINGVNLVLDRRSL
jgi:hypothetical protein